MKPQLPELVQFVRDFIAWRESPPGPSQINLAMLEARARDLLKREDAPS